MSRPTNKPAQGPKLSINIPAGWYAIVTAVSRRPYVQGLKVASDIIQNEARIFDSQEGSTNNLMKVTLNQATSAPFVTQPNDYDMELTFYYSATKVKDAEFLVNNDRFSSNINVVKTEKPPKSSGLDSVTFFVFVEDIPSEEAGTGRFDDGVATVHVVKREKK